MNLKISLLLLAVLAWPFCSQAQTARNPLNLEPARVSLQKGNSSWKLSEEVFYHADGTPFDKRSFLYDENGRKTSELTFQLNKTDKTWHNATTSEYLYENGKEIVLNMSGLQYTSKTEIISDAKGKSLYSFTYSWNRDADDWSVSPFLRNEWVYNEKGHLTTCLKQHINKSTNEWNDFDARIHYIYDETGALTEEIYQLWSVEQGQWTNRGKYSYANESANRKVAVSYIYASGNWVFDGKTVYIYDEQGKIARCEYFKNSTDNTPNAYSINTYSENAVIPEATETYDITVYPNPVISSFDLTVPEAFLGKTLYLFDPWGKQVKVLPVNNQTTTVDVTSLPSGVYLLKIADITKRIIIK
jgi:hypothetical protein